jgi:hypothetical protein
MIATTKNYDIICLQMRNYLPHLESPLKKEMIDIEVQIKSILTSEKKVKPSLDKLLPKIFDFRIKAIKWLLEEKNFNISEIFEEVYPQIEAIRDNPKLEILVENILFALRCNKRVINEVISSGDFPKESFVAYSAQLPTITYYQFLAALLYSIPDEDAVQKIIDWINASLYFEFMILSAVIIFDKKIKVSYKVVNELAFLIANAAQEYSAIATDLGILKTRSQKQFSFAGQIDESFVADQKYLADLGINDFAKLF